MASATIANTGERDERLTGASQLLDDAGRPARGPRNRHVEPQ